MGPTSVWQYDAVVVQAGTLTFVGEVAVFADVEPSPTTALTISCPKVVFVHSAPAPTVTIVSLVTAGVT